MNSPALLAAYQFITPETVVWGDMDAMGHVNNAKYFRYLETARIEFIRQVFPEFANPGEQLGSINLALAEVRCRFKVSLTHPDEILIGTGIASISDSQLIVQQEIYSDKLGCIAAEGDASLVYYDFAAKQKVPIPNPIVKKLQQFSVY